MAPETGGQTACLGQPWQVVPICEVGGPRSFEVLPSRWFLDFTSILSLFAPQALPWFVATIGTLPSEELSHTDRVSSLQTSPVVAYAFVRWT